MFSSYIWLTILSSFSYLSVTHTACPTLSFIIFFYSYITEDFMCMLFLVSSASHNLNQNKKNKNKPTPNLSRALQENILFIKDFFTIPPPKWCNILLIHYNHLLKENKNKIFTHVLFCFSLSFLVSSGWVGWEIYLRSKGETEEKRLRQRWRKRKHFQSPSIICV